MSARCKTLLALLVCAAAGSGCGSEDTERASEPTKTSPTPAAEKHVDALPMLAVPQPVPEPEVRGVESVRKATSHRRTQAPESALLSGRR